MKKTGAYPVDFAKKVINEHLKVKASALENKLVVYRFVALRNWLVLRPTSTGSSKLPWTNQRPHVSQKNIV